jgi:hypothetical protein
LALRDFSLDLTVGQVRHPLLQLRQTQLRLEGEKGTLALEHLEFMGQGWSRLQLTCGRLQLATGNFRCAAGHLHLPDYAPIALDLRQQGAIWRLQLRPTADESWDLTYDEAGKARLEVKNGKPDLLLALLPQLADLKALKPTGHLQGWLEYARRRDKSVLAGELSLSQGAYAAADGRQAAEDLELALSLSGEERQGKWQIAGQLAWPKGAVYSDPVFLKAGNQRLMWKGELDASLWTLRQATLEWPQIGTLTAKGQGDWQAGLRNLALFAPQLALQPLGEALLSPLLGSRGLPEVDLSGELDLQAEWQQGMLARLDMRPRNSGLALEKGRVALEGLNGQLAWRSEGGSVGELQVGRLASGRLESGAFRLPLSIWPKGFALTQPVTIPLLDSELVVNHMEAGFVPEREEWEGALGLSLFPMSLEKLTRVLDMPVMNGMLSADLPLIRYSRKEAVLEGAMVFQVFDGYLFCNDLRLIDPFGARPRILADVEARHIDLEQLTQTFSFGQITGFVDARLKALELAAWRPRAFTASIESSPGDYPRRISQKAVNNITALGGGGAMAAIQSSALRFFQDFGYRRMGLSCRLENGVCHMRGLDGLDRDGQYVMIEGGGIPALTVMGYNRQVNWEELVERLKAAIHNSSQAVIK